MDRRDLPPSSRNAGRSNSTSSANNKSTPRPMDGGRTNVQDFALFAAAAGGDLHRGYPSLMSHNTYPSLNPPPGFYGNQLHRNTMPPPQLPLGFPWNSPPGHQPQASGSHYASHPATSNTSLQPFFDTDFAYTTAQDRRGQQIQPAANQHTAGSPEVEQTEAEHDAIADEKRRRNTAASARFRIKKKNRAVTLERSVSDLTGRAEELEREATDLRRENGWLKEIVLLKGSQFAANNFAHQQALSRAATMVAATVPEAKGHGESEQFASELSSDASSDEEEKVPEKSKGKARARSKWPQP